MTTTLDLFGTAYVINLDQHTQRWELTQQELKKSALISYERFPGIVVNKGLKLRDRIQGCKESHLKLIEKAKREDSKQLLIFEDDIEFTPLFSKFLPIIANYLRERDWELFYLGANHLPLQKNFVPMEENLLNVFGALAAHAYLVHHTAYDRIIDEIKRSRYGQPVDVIYVEKIQNRGKSFAIRPNLVFQRSGFSYIRQAYRNYSDLRTKI